MKITRTAVLALTGNVTFAHAWTRLCDAVRAGDFRPSHWEAYVEDRRDARSSCADMAHRKLDIAAAEVVLWRGRRFLSHADAFSAESAGASMRLARSIPRPVSAWTAYLAMYAEAEMEPTVQADDRRPFHRISTWSSSVRVERKVDETWVTFSECVPSMSPTKPLEVPPQLGPVGWERTTITLSAEETRFARQASGRLAELLETPDAPRSIASASKVGGVEVKSWSKPFKAAFARDGWAYSVGRSQPRLHVAERKTPLGNIVALTADIGGAGKPRLPALNLTIERPELGMDVPLMRQKTIHTQEQWDATCALARKELDRVWEWLSAVVDATLGLAPAWNGQLPNVTRVT